MLLAWTRPVSAVPRTSVRVAVAETTTRWAANGDGFVVGPPAESVGRSWPAAAAAESVGRSWTSSAVESVGRSRAASATAATAVAIATSQGGGRVVRRCGPCNTDAREHASVKKNNNNETKMGKRESSKGAYNTTLDCLSPSRTWAHPRRRGESAGGGSLINNSIRRRGAASIAVDRDHLRRS